MCYILASAITNSLLSTTQSNPLQREEQGVSEWRRQVEECTRQAKEEAERNVFVFEQKEKKLIDDWTAQLQDKEVGTSNSLFLCRRLTLGYSSNQS